MSEFDATDWLKADFFTQLGLPKQYTQDAALLDARFRQLQREVHPDRFANADDATRRASMMLATQINAAYQTLRSPLQRATYLLSLSGIDVGAESNTAMSPDFLMEQMSWREQVGEARAAKDLVALEATQAEIAAKTQATYAELAALLDDQAQSGAAVETVRRLMFLEKLRDEIDNALHDLNDA